MEALFSNATTNTSLISIAQAIILPLRSATRANTAFSLRNFCKRQILPSVEELLRVLLDALDKHFKVEVRTRRTPRISHLCDLLAAFDQVALFHENS